MHVNLPHFKCMSTLQLRQGRWDKDDGPDRGSSDSDAPEVPLVKPAGVSNREWELQQEARELAQGAFAFDK